MNITHNMIEPKKNNLASRDTGTYLSYALEYPPAKYGLCLLRNVWELIWKDSEVKGWNYLEVFSSHVWLLSWYNLKTNENTYSPCGKGSHSPAAGFWEEVSRQQAFKENQAEATWLCLTQP